MSVLPVGFGSSGGPDTGDIGHSLRCRSAASAYLSKTITTDATSTYFAAVKRGKLGVVSPIFDTNIKFNANDTLTAFGLTTTAVFRDPTSWLFIHVSNGGLYINGVSFGAVTTSALTNPRIGFDGTNYFDGYIARIGCVAGSSSAYTNFGYLNTEINEWVTKSQSEVKAVVDAGGTNSFMLDFDDATSLTTLGYDKSSKGNDWTLNNFSLTAGTTYDHMLDVPGNSYCSLNPIDQNSNLGTTNANLTLIGTAGAGQAKAMRTSSGISTGKVYFEVRNDAANTSYNGIGLLSPTVVIYGVDFGFGFGSNALGWDLEWNNTVVRKRNNNVGTALTGTITAGDILQVAADLDTGKLWFGKNNTWYEGDPSAGTGASFTNLTGTLAPAGSMSVATAGESTTWNFGQRPFAYTPPTGFLALCQANLATPAILNPSSAVAHRFEAGSGIAASIASDRSGWSDWMEWFKRTDTTESWKVRFSDDSSNMMAFDTNGTKAAWSAPSTGTYLGAAFKVGATYGVVTGTYSGDSTSNKNISHSLGKAPTCGIVKNESTGTWYVWHTKMTSATYFTTLNSATPPAQSNTNTPWGTGNWSSTQFMVTNNATNNLNATGSTYRYILFADIDGLLALLGHTGNASTDGAFESSGHKSQLLIQKDLSATTGFYLFSDKIDTYNVTASYLLLNTNAGTASATGVDICSNGTKYRSATIANAANPHMGISYSRTAGKYSLAR